MGVAPALARTTLVPMATGYARFDFCGWLFLWGWLNGGGCRGWSFSWDEALVVAPSGCDLMHPNVSCF